MAPRSSIAVAVAVALLATVAGAVDFARPQPTVQSAILVLIWLSQLLIFGWPPMSWLKLREGDAQSARLWFGGLLLITSSAVVLGLSQRSNGVSGSTMIVGTCMFLEAMRREAGRRPWRWRQVSLPLALMLLTYLLIESLGLYLSAGVALTSLVLVVIEGALIRQIYTVGRRWRSRGVCVQPTPS